MATVRRARPSDLDALADLWITLLREQAALDPRFAPSDDAQARFRNDVPVWLEDDTRRLFVADDDGTLVGFATAHRWSPAPIYAFASEVYVDELYVKEAHRGHDVGRALVQAVVDWADALKAHRVRAGVLAANERGLAFWKEQGAEPYSVTVTIERDGPAREDEASRGKLGF